MKSEVFIGLISEGKDIITQFNQNKKSLQEIFQNLENQLELRKEEFSSILLEQNIEKSKIIAEIRSFRNRNHRKMNNEITSKIETSMKTEATSLTQTLNPEISLQNHLKTENKHISRQLFNIKTLFDERTQKVKNFEINLNQQVFFLYKLVLI